MKLSSFLFALMLTFGITSCATTDVQEPLPPIVEFTPVLVPVLVPDSFFVCPKRPPVPELYVNEETGEQYMKEEEAKDYVLGLRKAHQTCDASLWAVRKEMIDQKDLIEKSNPEGVIVNTIPATDSGYVVPNVSINPSD